MIKNLASYCSTILLLTGCSGGQKLLQEVANDIRQSSDIEAAARYLDIICPSNQVMERNRTNINKKAKLYNNNLLTKLGLGTAFDEISLSYAEDAANNAKALTDPGFIWPKDIRPLVAEMAAAEMEKASANREFVRNGGFEAAIRENSTWPDWPGEDANSRKIAAASAIRSALRLPPRSEGCSSGKRGLSNDQIKALQQN